MKCSICGNETAHSYRVYCDSTAPAKRGENMPDSNRLTGKAQMLSLRSGHDVYLEYDVPVCHQCVYPSQLRFNVIAALISGILGVVLLSVLDSKFWGIIPLVFCAGNIIFGIVHWIAYLQDKPNETFAANELSEYYNKGVPPERKTMIYSLGSLRAQMGKLGELKPVELSASDLARLAPTSPAAAAPSGNPALPTCWVFACYDRERAQGLAILRADFYKEENVLKRVREHLHIPESIDVKYVEASAWDAPGIHVVQDNFACDMDEIDGKVNAYLVRAGYSADKPKDAIKTTIPYPNAGLLLIIVNMIP